MAIKSADQVTILDVTDAYSVILSNEAHTFVGGTSTALAGSATTNVYAFQGDKQVPVTIGTITGKTGITASASGSGTTNAVVTFTVTTSLTSGGTIDIPVTITGTDITITKKFTYGIAFKGSTGQRGATGKGISKVETFYLTTSSGSNVTTGTTGWSTTPTATTTSKKYIWAYQKFTYTDNTTSTSTPAIVGTHGATGATGTAGADAITISITTDNGNIFKNSEGTTTMTAHVYKAGAELTDSQIEALGTLKWYKDGETTAVATGAQLSVSASAITNKAVYTVQLEG